MSCSRFATLVASSSFRWRGSTANGLARRTHLSQAFSRGFATSRVSAAAAKSSAAVRRKRGAKKSEEEMAKDLEALANVAHTFRVDVWNQPAETLDLMIPSSRSHRPNASIVDHLHALRMAGRNWTRNFFNMWNIAKADAFPGVKVKSALSLQLFKTQTTPWLAGLRRSALDTYKKLNEAVAANDDKTVKKLAIPIYQDAVIKRLRAQDRNLTYVWRLHGENKPCKVVSIRAYTAHLGKEDPAFGNRLLIQALVKFDTSQTLQVYNKKGKLLAGDGQPKPVVEYLVFQNRGWVDGPWQIREQLYEGLDSTFAEP